MCHNACVCKLKHKEREVPAGSIDVRVWMRDGSLEVVSAAPLDGEDGRFDFPVGRMIETRSRALFSEDEGVDIEIEIRGLAMISQPCGLVAGKLQRTSP